VGASALDISFGRTSGEGGRQVVVKLQLIGFGVILAESAEADITASTEVAGRTVRFVLGSPLPIGADTLRVIVRASVLGTGGMSWLVAPTSSSSLGLHFARGLGLPRSPHVTLILPSGIPPLGLAGPGASAWVTVPFPTPVAARHLGYVQLGNWGFEFSGNVSSMLESQLTLSDGTFLALDDVNSPPLGVARPAFFVHHGGSGALLADDVMRAELFDLSVTGFRYRIQQEGAGSVSYSPVFPLAITLAMCNWLWVRPP
jgi:hypothetical protein